MSWEIRCQDTSLTRGVWRSGNFLILSDLPQIITYRIRARGQSICVFSFRVFLKIVFSTVVRIVSQVFVPKFHGTRRIDLHSRTRFSTVLRESLSIQKPEIPRYLKIDCDIPRYEKFHSAFLIPTIYGLFCFFGKLPNSPDNFTPSY